jgi:hypothetical protein
VAPPDPMKRSEGCAKFRRTCQATAARPANIPVGQPSRRNHESIAFDH